MAIGRIGFFTAACEASETVKQILEAADFEVFFQEVSAAALEAAASSPAFDVVIVRSDLTDGSEESIFSLLLAAPGFLLLDMSGEGAGAEAASVRTLHSSMSPEEIVSRVNGVFYQHKDIRKSPRISVHLPVAYTWEEMIFQSTMQNLSLNGAFIASLNPPPRQALLPVSFELPGMERVVKTEARVLYSIGYDLDRGIISHPASAEKSIIAFPGMGIFFETLSGEDRESLARFISDRVY